ncbi:hypothetical protein J6590_073040 [Homalodisca vitripennis]|nr:hypothetical protein J6590_073040 [Homalodisca vitripennis]
MRYNKVRCNTRQEVRISSDCGEQRTKSVLPTVASTRTRLSRGSIQECYDYSHMYRPSIKKWTMLSSH